MTVNEAAPRPGCGRKSGEQRTAVCRLTATGLSARVRRSVLLLALVAACPLDALAQVPGPPLVEPRMQWGPLGLSPALDLREIGVDTNVFSETEDPKEDWTATFQPQLRSQLRVGPGLLTAINRADLVFYKVYSDQRAINSHTDARAELLLPRLRPYVEVELLKARERFNEELDVRVRRRERAYRTGSGMLFGTRFGILAGVERAHLEFDAQEEFRGVRLAETLNRRQDRATVSLRFAASPLTSVAVETSVRRDEFEFRPERNATGRQAALAFEFTPDAVISGRAMVGFDEFRIDQTGVEDYRGIVASVNVTYALLGRTRFLVQAVREATASFEEDAPYFVRTGGSLTVTQHLLGPLDVQARGGRELHEYRSAVLTNAPSDYIDTMGAGVGVHFADTSRLGFNVDRVERTSTRSAGREYGRLRMYATWQYEF